MVQSSPLACQHSKCLVHFLGLSALYGTVRFLGLSAQYVTVHCTGLVSTVCYRPLYGACQNSVVQSFSFSCQHAVWLDSNSGSIEATGYKLANLHTHSRTHPFECSLTKMSCPLFHRDLGSQSPYTSVNANKLQNNLADVCIHHL